MIPEDDYKVSVSFLCPNIKIKVSSTSEGPTCDAISEALSDCVAGRLFAMIGNWPGYSADLFIKQLLDNIESSKEVGCPVGKVKP